MVTSCSGFGYSASCVTTGGQYTPPVSVPYDANGGARQQVYQGCMYSEGWTLERKDAASSCTLRLQAKSPDWTKGLNWGVAHGAAANCDAAPADITNPNDWILGCRSGRKGH